MARVSPIEFKDADPRAHAEWNRQVEAHGRMTNMKRTLARSPLALETYMQWYPLRDQVQEFLGERLTTLIAHAISAENDCLVCSTYFRRYLIDAGENPDQLVLDDREQAFVDLGRQIARDPRRVSNDLYTRIASYLSPDQIVAVTAFAGQMVATNLIIHVLQIDLDEYLTGYR